jgi:hypothetical protein
MLTKKESMKFHRKLGSRVHWLCSTFLAYGEELMKFSSLSKSSKTCCCDPGR